MIALSATRAACCFLLRNPSHCVSSHVLDSPKKVRTNPRKGKTKPNPIKPERKDNYHLHIYRKVCGLLGPQ